MSYNIIQYKGIYTLYVYDRFVGFFDTKLEALEEAHNIIQKDKDNGIQSDTKKI